MKLKGHSETAADKPVSPQAPSATYPVASDNFTLSYSAHGICLVICIVDIYLTGRAKVYNTQGFVQAQ